MHWKAEKEEDGMRLSHFLRQHGFSAALLKKVKYRGGAFLVNGQAVFVNYILKAGDELEVVFPLQAQSSILPEAIPLRICYEDEHYLLVNKPAGLVVHPTMGAHFGTLAAGYMALMEERGCGGAVFRPLNRLDKDTSGLVMLAKTPYGAAACPKDIDKKYLAFTQPGFLKAEGVIELPIAREPGSVIKRAVDPAGKYSKTAYRLLWQGEQAALVELTLFTGRTHQIRVHMAALGCPLLGDTLYGGSAALFERQALHCASLSFCHPVSGERIKVKAPLPDDFIFFSTKFNSLHILKIMENI